MNNFGRALPKEHPCQVSSRLAQWFRRRRCLKKLWTTDDARRTPEDIGRLQKLTMSTLCSGELKIDTGSPAQTVQARSGQTVL